MIILVISLLTRPSKINVSYYEEEIKKLNMINQKIVLKNDSIILENKKLDELLKSVDIKIDSIDKVILSKDSEINKLKNQSNEIPENVFNMGADDVTRNLSEYLKRRN